MPAEPDLSGSDDLIRQFLFQEDEVVCKYPLHRKLIQYLWPMYLPVSVAIVSLIFNGTVPDGMISFTRTFGIITAVWAAYVFFVDVRGPQTIHAQGHLVTFEWWFGRRKVIPIEELDVLARTDDSPGYYAFWTPEFSVDVSSSMKDIAVLADRVNQSRAVRSRVDVEPCVDGELPT